MRTGLVNEIRNRLYDYSLFFLAISLPFQRWIPPTYGLVAIIVGWLIQSPWRKKYERRDLLPILAFSTFFIYILSLELNQDGSLANAVKLVPVLLLPPAILLSRLKDALAYRVALAFSVACNLALLVDLGIGLNNMFDSQEAWNSTPARNFLFYNKLSYLIPKQAHYFALYLSLSFFISLHRASNGFRSGRLHWFWILSAALHLTGIGLLAARAQIVAFAVVAFVFILTQAVIKRQWKFSVLLLFVSASILGTVLLLSPGTKHRMEEMKDEVMGMSQGDGGIPARLYIWKKASEIIAKDPWFGAGIHQAYPKLWEMARTDLDLILHSTSPLQIAQTNHPLRHEVLTYKMTDIPGQSLYETKALKIGPGMKDKLLWESDSCDSKTLYRVITTGNHRKKGGLQVFQNSKAILGVREALDDSRGSDQFFSCTNGPVRFGSARYVDSELEIDHLQLIAYSNLTEGTSALDQGLWNAAETFLHRLLGHNQYVDLLLRFGGIGLFLFMSGIIFLLSQSIKQGHNLLLIFIGLVLVSFLFEHMLNRQAGIFFIPLFLLLLRRIPANQEER